MKYFTMLLMTLLFTSCGHWGKGCYLKKYDSNGDGKITKSEWIKGSEAKFKKKDKNGDGVISSDEIKMCKKKCSTCKKSCDRKSKCNGKSCARKKS